MHSIASQLIVTESGDLLRNSLVRFNNQTLAIEYAGIFDGVHEQAHTVFYDGIISPPIVSLAAFTVDDTMRQSFDYIDLIACPSPVLDANSRYIFDIHTQDVAELNAYLAVNFALFSALSMQQLIAAFTSYPAQVLQDYTSNSRLVWQNADLVKKKITASIKITVIDL